MRNNVIVDEGLDDWLYFRKTLYRVKMRIGSQEFAMRYESYEKESADAYAELLRKGLAYIVVGSMASPLGRNTPLAGG